MYEIRILKDEFELMYVRIQFSPRYINFSASHPRSVFAGWLPALQGRGRLFKFTQKV